MLVDICGPLLAVEEIHGANVAEVGSGSGRIVNMLAKVGAGRITALEPSDAFISLQANTQEIQDCIEYVNEPGENLPLANFDYVFSIGVIHHIPEPQATVKRIFASLRDGGEFLVWLYGKEGNELYLSIAEPIRRITQRMPASLLSALSWVFSVLLSVYANLCRWLTLPMRDYMRSVILPLGWRQRFLVVFDQLNPAYAKYYTKAEAEALLAEAGFSDIKLYHRHGYSWTVSGKKGL